MCSSDYVLTDLLLIIFHGIPNVVSIHLPYPYIWNPVCSVSVDGSVQYKCFRNGVAAYNRDVMRYERSLTCVNYGYVYVCGTVLSDDVASITLSKS